jgi:hypothetical protein
LHEAARREEFRQTRHDLRHVVASDLGRVVAKVAQSAVHDGVLICGALQRVAQTGQRSLAGR